MGIGAARAPLVHYDASIVLAHRSSAATLRNALPIFLRLGCRREWNGDDLGSRIHLSAILFLDGQAFPSPSLRA